MLLVQVFGRAAKKISQRESAYMQLSLKFHDYAFRPQDSTCMSRTTSVLDVMNAGIVICIFWNISGTFLHARH